MFREVPGAQRLDLSTQLAGYALVRIEAQYPVVTGGFDGELLLRPVPGPIALDDTRIQAACDLASSVCRMGINDDNLVAEAQRPQASIDPIRLVVRDDAGGQLHWHRIPLM